eukprot:jgi/Mesvir1/13930/Mv16051-RA.1
MHPNGVLFHAVVTDGCPAGWMYTAAAGCLVLTSFAGTYTTQAAACEASWPSAYPGYSNPSHLAIITDSDMNIAANAVCDAQPCFLGLIYSETQGTFVWLDGTEVSYTNWYSGQPEDTAGYYYTFLDPANDQQWFATTSSDIFPALCQIAPFCDKDTNCPADQFCVNNTCIVDVTPPELVCPEEVSRLTLQPGALMSIEIGILAQDRESGTNVLMACTISLPDGNVRLTGTGGSLPIRHSFPYGSTAVSCVATDTSYNDGACEFMVSVGCAANACPVGQICSKIGCIDCVDSVSGNRTDFGCDDADLRFCASLSDGQFSSRSANQAGTCVVCSDTADGIEMDAGCTEQLPMCAVMHTVSSNGQLDVQGALDVSVVSTVGDCFACRNDQWDDSMDFGCSEQLPFCNVDRNEDGYGKGCTDLNNPNCLYTIASIIPDDDVTCSTGTAVEVRIALTLANCVVTRLDLLAMASTMASVMNIPNCTLQLDFVSDEATIPPLTLGRRLLADPGNGTSGVNITTGFNGTAGNVTLLLFAFVPAGLEGDKILADISGTIQLATLLAVLEGNVGEVIAINVAAALVQLGSVTSDPHFVTPLGHRFDFQGAAGQTYCIVTDKRLHVNARFVGAAKSSLATNAAGMQAPNVLIGVPNASTDGRTWMDQVSVLHGGDRVLVDAASAPGTPYTASFGTVHVNGGSLTSSLVSRMQGKWQMLA